MKMAPMILQPSPKCADDQSATIALLIKFTQVLYGLRVENLSVELWQASFEAICERFKDITIQDVQLAFRYSQIEKKAYQTLTRDELLEPIQTYWTGKLVLIAEIKHFQNLSREENEAIEKELSFRQAAKQKYFDCLELGKWNGDEAEANSIARNFREVFSQEIKNEIWSKAKQEYAKRKIDAEKISSVFVSIPCAEHIFSRLIIERCIENKTKWVEI